MNKTLTIACAAGLSLGALTPLRGQAQDQARPAPALRELPGSPGSLYDPTSLLVKFREGTDAAMADHVAAVLGGQVARRFRLVPGLHHVILSAMDSADAASLLERMPFVEYAVPDGVDAPADTTPDDTRFAEQWGLHNTGQTVNGDPGTNDADIDGPAAWSWKNDASGIVVAVIDTGARTTHEDLKDNLWKNSAESAGTAGVDDDGNGYVDDLNGWDVLDEDKNVSDSNGHGTNVAGVIGARGNNGKGITGVAWRVKLMILRFGGSRSDAIEGIEYAVDKGADIINYSWGGATYDSAFEDAIESAGARGLLFVCAAGNDGVNVDSSARYPSRYTSSNIVSVAALDNDDALASWSNWGSTSVDLGAPGVNILTTDKDSNSDYAFVNGTSFASPMVAGAAAVLWAQNPLWSRADIKDRLLDEARGVSSLSGKCVSDGALDLDDAMVTRTPNAPSNCNVTDGGPMFPDIARVTWTDSSDNEDGFVVWRGRYFPERGRWLYTSVGTVSANTTVYAESPGTGTWRYKVRAYNAAGNSAFSNTASITLP